MTFFGDVHEVGPCFMFDDGAIPDFLGDVPMCLWCVVVIRLIDGGWLWIIP